MSLRRDQFPQAVSVLNTLASDADPIVAALANAIKDSWKNEPGLLTRLVNVANNGPTTLARVSAIFALWHIIDK